MKYAVVMRSGAMLVNIYLSTRRHIAEDCKFQINVKFAFAYVDPRSKSPPSLP
jgi:hypothetical protein